MATKPKAIEPAATNGSVTLVAIEPIRHDGDDVAPGKTFAALPEAAAALYAAGAAKEAK